MSTITLYKLPQNILGKNNQYDSWYTYLGTYTTPNKLVISDFQYLKIDLELTIKISMAQANVPYAFEYNYLQVTQDSKNYYFLIKKVKQLAKETLELELHMDVLNTYQ